MDKWILKQNGSENNAFYTNIFALGNGYMGSQAFDEEEVSEFKYELCAYIAGVFEYFSPNKTDMASTPNYWKTAVYIDGERFSAGAGEVVEYRKELNMKLGTLNRRVVWKNGRGRETLIETTRFLSMDDIHCAVMRIDITPLNYSGEIRIETGIDADVRNCIIDDDQMKTDVNLVSFWEQVNKNDCNSPIQTISLKAKQSCMEICEGFDTEIYENSQKIDLCKQIIQGVKYTGQEYVFPAAEGNVYTLNKYISVWTSRDTGGKELTLRVNSSVADAQKNGFDKMLKNHSDVWAGKWDISDIIIDGDDEIQQALRYNIFQLIQTNAENDPDANIGARGIMHGRYKGCYFWDTEILMFPFYLYTNPKAARNLLMYRYNTIRGAEENARRQNLEGARYPWMSAIDGLDQCDSWDIGFSEVHITADIAYAVNQYYEATGDIEFIRDQGLEILIKTSRYWTSRFSYDAATDKYNLLFVKGPNEYGGVANNNLYTVMMAVNNLQLAIKFINLIIQKYPESYNSLVKKISFKTNEIENWEKIIGKPVINYDEENSLFIEDDNFLKLEPLDLSSVKDGDRPLYNKICFDRLQRYRILKQADVILLMLLLPQKFTLQEKISAWKCYEPITTHDSSLSYGTHAEFAVKINRKEEAYSYLKKSVLLDLHNIMGNSEKEGIHFAALGSSWQAVVNGFAGVELIDGKLHINPPVLTKWKRLSLKLFYRQCLLKIVISGNELSVIYETGLQESIEITVCFRSRTLKKGLEERSIILQEAIL